MNRRKKCENILKKYIHKSLSIANYGSSYRLIVGSTIHYDMYFNNIREIMLFFKNVMDNNKKNIFIRSIILYVIAYRLRPRYYIPENEFPEDLIIYKIALDKYIQFEKENKGFCYGGILEFLYKQNGRWFVRDFCQYVIN